MENVGIREILKNEYQANMISKGDNSPKIKPSERKYLMEICILLHNKIATEDIREYLNLTNSEMKDKIEVLLREELIRKVDENKYLPTCMITNLEEGEKIYKNTDKFIEPAVGLMKANIEQIKSKTYYINCFANFSFQSISLFILSDVLMDTVQINNVEDLFLNSSRPKRNGMNYYFSLFEKPKGGIKESFGIYGNMYREYGNIAYGLYGNERIGYNFHTNNEEKLKEIFGMQTCDVDKVKEELLIELVKKSKDESYSLDPVIEEGFIELGFIENHKVCIPILSKVEFEQLSDIADVIKNEYIQIFSQGKDYIYESYRELEYINEITFEEYFIFWYHFFYTKVTDALIENNMIIMPKLKNFSYVVIP